jgi:protein gp37
MSETTNIAWCDSTINFWSGCTKVSEGCAHCYAETLSNRGMTNPKGEKTIGQWGKGAPRRLHESAFKLAHRLNAKPWICDSCGNAQEQVNCGGCEKCHHSDVMFHRRRIFSLSLGDWLDPEVPIEWTARMLHTIYKCDQVVWILCTKRPELWFIALKASIERVKKGDLTLNRDFQFWLESWLNGVARKNIILLASVENNEQFIERTPILLGIPAVCHGLSMEPLLGPIDCLNYNFWATGHARRQDKTLTAAGVHTHLKWIIIGGESGKKARPCDVDWITSLVKQGQAAGVPTFVKQLGANPIENGLPPLRDAPGSFHKKWGDPSEWPVNLRIQEFPEL